MKLVNVCSRPAITASASATLAEVAALMHERNVGAVIITKAPADARIAVGMVTDRDILRAQLDHSADLSRLSAAVVMTRDPLELQEDCDIDEAIRRLRAAGVRRAPVISASGALVGMVSTDDLVAQLAENLMGLACALSRSVRS